MGQLKSGPLNWVRPKVRIKELMDYIEKLIKSNQILNQIKSEFSRINTIVVDGQVHIFDQTKQILVVAQYLNLNHQAGQIETS